MDKNNWKYFFNKLLSVPIYVKIIGTLLLIVIAVEFTTIAYNARIYVSYLFTNKSQDDTVGAGLDFAF